MAPHAQRTPSDSGRAVNGTDPLAELDTTTHCRGEAISTPPLRDQLSALYEDNITAKIVKVAVAGLRNNVRTLGYRE